MEGEVREQVAPPIVIGHALQSRFCDNSSLTKKRDFPWKNINCHPQHQLLQFQHQRQQLLSNCESHQNPKNNWNGGIWCWDSINFAAKPNEPASGNLQLRTAEPELKKRAEGAPLPLSSGRSSALCEGGELLTLKLGGGSHPAVVEAEEPVVRPNKRVRPGSPAGGNNYPMCQVDDCGVDLSNAKDYHRRHKVCELHSKITKALVRQQMQRFCQQCSRFHPLSEFDEGKRSCRRRLAGHNRRRRKCQSEDTSSKTTDTEDKSGGNIDIIKLLTILAQLQGKNNEEKAPNVLSIPDKDHLIPILNKLNSLTAPPDSSARLSKAGSLDLNISQALQDPPEHISKINGYSHGPSTMDFLPVQSAALAGAASSSNSFAILSQGIVDSGGADKSNVNSLDQEAGFHERKKTNSLFPLTGFECGFRSEVGVSNCQTQDLSLQLFNPSPGDESPPKLRSTRNHLSSDSSNHMDERSPSSSPPIEQNLFPLHSSALAQKYAKMSNCREDVITESRAICGKSLGFEIFRESKGRTENGSIMSNLPQQSDYSSSSSDHSPNTSNSGSQERTGRIIFKLFGKDPSDFPGSLRNEIFNWLSRSPSEMESYIRPGCVVLSIYVSMPSISWEELDEKFLQHVSSLIQDSDTEFWRRGRFLVHTDRQLVSHKDGKIRLLKPWRTWNAPELISVSPIAIVAGMQTSLVLRGRNLTVPGTKIHCTYMGGYISEGTSESLHSDATHDNLSIESFNFPGGAAGKFGRCFIEVENGLKGNTFPLIIADAKICTELRQTESEFEEDARLLNDRSEDQIMSSRQSRARKDTIHFLNELGWMFQKMGTGRQFSYFRMKFLVIFAVERDWTALVKTFLDHMFEDKLGIGCPPKELLETVEEMHILNRAVKRKCRNMVNLLLHYTISNNHENMKTYLFLPNQAGPSGLTPLHLAACTQDSDEIVDELTNDPQSIGLNCWNSLLDSSGQSPRAYALRRNHHSYNQMVTRKLMDRKKHQVSLTVGCPEISLHRTLASSGEPEKLAPLSSEGRPCAQCAFAAARYSKRLPGSRGLVHRHFLHPLLAVAAVCVFVCLLTRWVSSGQINQFSGSSIVRFDRMSWGTG